MELLVAADSIFFKTPDGKYWCKTIYEYDFWLRYLNVYDRVAVVSRTKNVSYEEVSGYLRVDGENVRVLELPFMRGMKQYILNFVPFYKASKKAAMSAEGALIRLPSISASMVLKHYKRTKKPYALEVVADPSDAYVTNKIARIIYTNQLKKAAMEANGVSYVTKEYLQKKYPSYAQIHGGQPNYFESYYSTINLKDSFFGYPKKYNFEKRTFTIIHTANSINNDMKGHSILMKVLKTLLEKGFDVRIVFIGDGDKRGYFEKLAEDLKIAEYISFTGLLATKEKVREYLLDADIFVFPSKAEGLPRAVIEAMAVGLPVLASNVNGIPELLKDVNMFDPLDVDGFTTRLEFLFTHPLELEQMSIENIAKAREYSEEIISFRRNEFYKKLRMISESNKF